MKFNEDMIRRSGLAEDVFGLIHDLAYDHEGRDREQYKARAQEILARDYTDNCEIAHLKDRLCDAFVENTELHDAMERMHRNAAKQGREVCRLEANLAAYRTKQ